MKTEQSVKAETTKEGKTIEKKKERKSAELHLMFI